MCDHKNKYGNWDYETHDDRCSTDRGTFGEVWLECNNCGEDITELVMAEEREDDFPDE